MGYRVLSDFGIRSIGIRVERLTGTPTEYDKLLLKPLDIYFFGWSRKINRYTEDRELVDWIIYDPIKFVDLGYLKLAQTTKKPWPNENPVETLWGWIPVEEALDCIICSKRDFNNGAVMLSLF